MSYTISGIFAPGATLRIEKHHAKNMLGATYQSFFVLIVLWLVAPFRTFGHPSDVLEDVRHVVKYPAIDTLSDDYGAVVAMAAVAFLAYGVSFVGYYIYQVCTLPKRANQSVTERDAIRRSCRFVFLRFKPEAWFWGAVLIVRNFLWSCVIFVPSGPNSMGQLLYLFLVLTAYIVLQIRYWPWLTSGLNLVETVQNAGLLAMVVLCMPLAGNPGEDSDVANFAATGLLLGFVLGIVFICIYMGREIFLSKSKSRSAANVSKLVAKLQTTTTEVQALAKVMSGVETEKLLNTFANMDIADLDTATDAARLVVAPFAPGIAKPRATQRLHVFPVALSSVNRISNIHSTTHDACVAPTGSSAIFPVGGNVSAGASDVKTPGSPKVQPASGSATGSGIEV